MTEEAARRSIRFTCSRRHFWRALVQEAVVSYESARGRTGARLSELGSLAADELAALRPVMDRAYKITMRQGQVCARAKAKEELLELFPAVQENLAAYNLFDGRHTLREAGQEVARQMGWEEERGFAHARRLFLFLVARQVCRPAGPPAH